jgi:predicted secreted hydrolase
MKRTLIGLSLGMLAACSAGHGTDSAGLARHRGGMSPLDVLHAGAADRGFARALGVRRFVFPQDQGPHPAYRHEWWYWTGHLTARDGERFGFELTFFRIALAPPKSGPSTSTAAGALALVSNEPGERSLWHARQIYIAHFAITDVGRREFHSSARYARAALGLAGAQASPFRVWLDSWSVGAEGTSGDWILKAADPEYGLRLELRPLSAPVLNGDRGLSVKSSSSASYYFSIPRLTARGRLVRGGQALEVTGSAWLDREWGSGALGPRESGWDWFALQFDDGSDLMFYSLRDLDGRRDPHSAGTWISPDGKARALSSDDVGIEVLGRWHSPRGTVYPSRWRVRVRSLGLDVEITPVLADQELDTTPMYWEGDAAVRGTRAGHGVRGKGYVELVGYAVSSAARAAMRAATGRARGRRRAIAASSRAGAGGSAPQ